MDIELSKDSKGSHWIMSFWPSFRHVWQHVWQVMESPPFSKLVQPPAQRAEAEFRHSLCQWCCHSSLQCMVCLNLEWMLMVSMIHPSNGNQPIEHMISRMVLNGISNINFKWCLPHFHWVKVRWWSMWMGWELQDILRPQCLKVNCSWDTYWKKTARVKMVPHT